MSWVPPVPSTTTSQLHWDGAFDLYFYTSSDPRECTILGYEYQRPIFFRFETLSAYASSTRTIVYRNPPSGRGEEEEVAALFDWTGVAHLGLATVNSMSFPMSNLVTLGANSNCRRFTLLEDENKSYEWRRDSNDKLCYELLDDNRVIARFSGRGEMTSVGPTHGRLTYTFQNQELLLMALLALSLNRWVDKYGW